MTETPALPTAPKRYKVVVVDDSLTMRRWLGSVFSKDPRLDLVGIAGSAQEARAIIKSTNPDVLTLDIEMPGVDGLEFLAHIMRLRPMPVVMLASSIGPDSAYAKKAGKLGAVDCIAKPRFPTPVALSAMCDSVVAAAAGVAGAAQTNKPASSQTKFSQKLVVLGASTGGVAAIEEVLSSLPPDIPPIVIAQHMPHTFLESFVTRLDRLLPYSVDFARDGMRLEPGDIRVAPSQDTQTCVGWHSNAWHVQCTPRRYDHTFCPSVDVLFASAVPWADKVGAVLLTGLGSDGAKGMLALRRNGASTIGQNEASCVVYGMPGAALALDASEEEADIGAIGPKILSRIVRNDRAPVSP